MPIFEKTSKPWPTVLGLLGVAVMCVAWWTKFWWFEWFGGFLVYNALMWLYCEGRWRRLRMLFRLHIPESTRLGSLNVPRCDLVLESSGDDSRKMAKALQRVYVLAPREARELCRKAPVVLKSGVWRAEADLAKAKLEAAGAVVRTEPRLEPGA